MYATMTLGKQRSTRNVGNRTGFESMTVLTLSAMAKMWGGIVPSDLPMYNRIVSGA